MTANDLSALPVEAKLPTIAKVFYGLMKRLDSGSLSFTSPEGYTTIFRGTHEGTRADLRFAQPGVTEPRQPVGFALKPGLLAERVQVLHDFFGVRRKRPR